MNDQRMQKDLTRGIPAIEATIQYVKQRNDIDEYIYDTVDRARTNLWFDPVKASVYDGRHVAKQLSLAENGFELTAHVSKFARLGNDQGGIGDDVRQFQSNYIAEMIPYVREVSGTPHIYAPSSGFVIRHGKRSAIRTPARPAGFAHCDYTAPTAEKMAYLLLHDCGKQSLGFRHFAIYQTWRAVSPPPQDSFLALCDGRTVRDEDYVILRTITGPQNVPGNVFINKAGLAKPHHRWFYFSDLTDRDMLLFMAHDSRRPQQLSVLHTSILNPLADDFTIPRVSVEARFFAFFE